MKHYYPDVPGIGNVAVSRHAQDRLAEDGISEREFEAVLLRGDSVPEGQDILWRQKDGIRLVILLKPEPFRGATLVKTAYRIEPKPRRPRKRARRRWARRSDSRPSGIGSTFWAATRISAHCGLSLIVDALLTPAHTATSEIAK